jgi:hypothetical protein
MTDDYRPNTEAVAEGSDFDYARRIRVILFGREFAACDDSETLGLSASGLDALKTLAIPAPVLRRMWEAKAGGNLVHAYLVAVKEVGR